MSGPKNDLGKKGGKLLKLVQTMQGIRKSIEGKEREEDGSWKLSEEAGEIVGFTLNKSRDGKGPDYVTAVLPPGLGVLQGDVVEVSAIGGGVRFFVQTVTRLDDSEIMITGGRMNIA